MRKVAKEQLLRRSSEVKVRNRKRIDRRKYFGIGKHIEEYTKKIQDFSAPLGSFDSIFQLPIGTLFDKMEIYFAHINNKLFDFRDELNEHFDESYSKGTKRVMNRKGEPIKVDAVQDLSSLEFLKNQQLTYIKNITDKQRQIMQKILQEGTQANVSVEEMVQSMRDKIEGMTEARAKMIARTEMVKAHNHGQLQTMKEVGLPEYIFWTAGDKRVCKICRGWQGSRENPKVYSVERAGDSNNPLPTLHTHPNCRCTLLIND